MVMRAVGVVAGMVLILATSACRPRPDTPQTRTERYLDRVMAVLKDSRTITSRLNDAGSVEENYAALRFGAQTYAEMSRQITAIDPAGALPEAVQLGTVLSEWCGKSGRSFEMMALKMSPTGGPPQHAKPEELMPILLATQQDDQELRENVNRLGRNLKTRGVEHKGLDEFVKASGGG